MNRPFYSTNSNIYDESTCSSAPMNLVGQNVIVSQGQQRQVYDTFNTSVVGVNQNQMPANYPIQCQKQCVPGGVTFSFQTQNQGFVPQVQQPMQNPYCPCNTNNSKSMTQQDYPQQRVPCYPSQTQNPPIQYHQQQQQYLPSGAMSNLQTQMAWSEFQRQALEYDRLMRKNPFQLTFHQDSTTNTDDLLNCTTQVPPSRGLPDFSNICGVVPPDFLQADSTMKKLMLKEPPSPVQGHVADILDPPPKQVSFCEAEPAKDESPKSTRTDFQCQVDTPCRCESTQVTSMETFWFSAEDAEHFGSRDRSRSARESSMNEEFSSDDEDRPKRPPRNKRKKRMNCRRNNRRRRLMCQNLRKPDARLTFGDLAELSNIWLLELDDWVNVFTRQVQTSNKAIQDNNSSIQKLQCLNQRLNLCKLLDEQITHNINYITVRQDVLLQLVLQLESQVLGRGMKGSLSSCVSRKDMYKIVEELSCFITNSKELLEQLAYKCQSDAHSAKADPIYIITRLMEISLELLEQTEMKVFELKKHISFVQHLKQLTLRKLHLKENQLY